MTATYGVPRADGPPRADEAYSATWLEEPGIEEPRRWRCGRCRADLVVLSRPTPGNETAALMTLNSALMRKAAVQSWRRRRCAKAIPGRFHGSRCSGTARL